MVINIYILDTVLSIFSLMKPVALIFVNLWSLLDQTTSELGLFMASLHQDHLYRIRLLLCQF